MYHGHTPIQLLLVFFTVHTQVSEGSDRALEHLVRGRAVANYIDKHSDRIGVARCRLHITWRANQAVRKWQYV